MRDGGQRCFPVFPELTGDHMLPLCSPGSTKEIRCSPQSPGHSLCSCSAAWPPSLAATPGLEDALQSLRSSEELCPLSDQPPGCVCFRLDSLLSWISQRVLTLLALFRILTKVIT